MPVFSVEKVAAAARKDEKTIRIWCAKGFVPGAKRKRGGPGRHWRINGESAAAIAAEAHKRAKGFARRRPTKLQTSLRQFEDFAKVFRKTVRASMSGAKVGRSAQMYFRIVRLVSDCLLERTDAMLDELGLSRRYIERFVDLPLKEDFPKVFTAALCCWMLESRNGSRSSVARSAGVSRRTLERHFGPYWQGASAAVSRMIENAPEHAGGWQSAGRDKRTGQKISEAVAEALPEGLAAEDPAQVRAWRGALRNESSTSRGAED